VPARRQTENVAAYEALLEGRYHFFQFTPDAAERALECFRRALSFEPGYPDALVEHGFYHLMMAYMFSDPRDMLPHVRALAERALQFDPHHGEAQAAVAAMAVFWDRDWTASESAFRRAIELSPASAQVHALYGLCCLLGQGRFADALAELDRAIELDPLSALYAGNRGRVLTCSGRFAEAEESCRRGLALDPKQLLTQVELIYALLFQDKFEEAIAVGKRAIETHGPVNAPRQALALSHALAGQRDAAMRLVSEGAEAAGGYRSPLALGLVHAAFSEMDEAFDCVEQSLEGRDLLLVYLNVHPMFDPLRGDSRFPSLVERVGLLPSVSSADVGPSDASNEISDRSIAVLPFVNMSDDRDNEFFSDGLSEEIISDLSGIGSLRVISRTSVMRLKGTKKDVRTIGRELGVRYVLEGSVRKAGDDLRITAQLVDARTDAQLWADKYGGILDDVFDIQERVSRSIVDALEIQLSPKEAAQLAERPIADVRAQESYFRARSEIWSFMPGSLDLAISHLEAALDLIGDNALIYQGLGEAYFQYVNIGAAIGREEELIGKAEDCVNKIFALDPDSPRGYLVRAQTQMARGDIHGSGRSLRRVLQSFPNEIMALQLYTHLLGWLGGKPDAAAPVAARLVDVDPLNPMSLLVNAMVPLFAGRFTEAVEAARRMFELDPVTPVWRANYVMALSYARHFEEAEALAEAVDAQPDSDVGTWQIGLFQAAWREDRAEVLRLADGPYQQVAAWDAEVPWLLASAHAAVGATDEALHWLDRAIDQGMINYPFLSEHDWYLDSIRGDERFGRAMERARREWKRLDEVLP
jgi:TolB-like protein/Tfp pilus assembly protein PilF